MLLVISANGRAAEDCLSGKDLILENGQFLTMNSGSDVATAVRVSDELIVAVDDVGDTSDPCVTVIDLEGRTVIPGLIDSHAHFVRAAQAPGHFVEGIESARTISDLLKALEETARDVPPGEMIAEVGYSALQFEERRLPTYEELDEALPEHPVYLQESYYTPGLTNSLGREYFEARGLGVLATGIVPAESLALGALLREREPAHVHDRILTYMNYAVSLGLTSVVDQGCCFWHGVEGYQPTDIGSKFDWPGLTYVRQFWRAGLLPIRIRLQYNHGGIADQNSPYSVTSRMDNSTMGLGNDMLKVVGVGEQVIGHLGTVLDEEETVEVFREIATRGWMLTQHAMREAEIEYYIGAMEKVAAEMPLGPLRWRMEHVFEITDEQIERLKAIDVGVGVQNQDYHNNKPLYWEVGPPFRSLLESGIRMGAGTDAHITTPLNPWLCIYYMVTGRDAAGSVINPGQQIGRLDALRLYTIDNAWFTFEENELGSIETGKLADLVVLDRPFLTVDDEEIRDISSVLTLVNGRIRHAEGVFSELDVN